MTRSRNQGPSRRPPSMRRTTTRECRNGGKAQATLVGWSDTAFLSAREVGEGVKCKSPNYFESLEIEDPDLLYAIMESLCDTVPFDLDYQPQNAELTVSILEMAKPAKNKAVSSAHVDGVTQPKGQSLEAFPDEEFEVWEDDVYEKIMAEDDWEEVCDEKPVNIRRSYSSVLRGNDNNR